MQIAQNLLLKNLWKPYIDTYTFFVKKYKSARQDVKNFFIKQRLIVLDECLEYMQEIKALEFNNIKSLDIDNDISIIQNLINDNIKIYNSFRTNPQKLEENNKTQTQILMNEFGFNRFSDFALSLGLTPMNFYAQKKEKGETNLLLEFAWDLNKIRQIKALENKRNDLYFKKHKKRTFKQYKLITYFKMSKSSKISLFASICNLYNNNLEHISELLEYDTKLLQKIQENPKIINQQDKTRLLSRFDKLRIINELEQEIISLS